MVLGMFSFSLFYYLQISFFYQFVNNKAYTLIYGLSLPITGFFTYHYWQYFNKIKRNWQYIKLAKNRGKVLENLHLERAVLIAAFEKAKTVFLKQFPY